MASKMGIFFIGRSLTIDMSLYGDTLFTSRMALSKISEENILTFIAWSRSEEACGAYLTPENYDLEQMRQQLKDGVYWNDTEKMFWVETKEEKKPIGTAHYWRSTTGSKSVTMALKVAVPEERGKGYGTEIQKFLIMYIFDRLSADSIEMYTDLNNLPQQRCLYKLGFKLIESLNYDDRHVKRTGHLFRLTATCYKKHPIYHFHYE